MRTLLKPRKSGFRSGLVALGSVLSLTLAPSSLLAQENSYPGPETTVIIVDNTAGQNITTASQINGLEEGQDVLLQGNIMEHRGEDTYLFEDMSGTAAVIISKADMQKLQARPKNKVELSGKTVREGSDMMVKVVRAVKMN